MTSFRDRLQKLCELLKEDEIDLEELRNICSKGIPDVGNLRAICWRLLLDYLPTRQCEWEEFLKKQRKVYADLVMDLIVRPGLEEKTQDQVPDHPLNPNPSSEWNVYFQDNEVLLQIDKDVRRLCPEISFFQQATEFPCRAMVDDDQLDSLSERVANSFLKAEDFKVSRSGAANLVSSRKVATEEYKSLKAGQEAHWEVVQRILFIYSKLNPGVKYVQGMNEIMGPIYYVLASDQERKWSEGAEADAFFCFQNLMSEIRDNFIKTLDSSSCGIESKLTEFYELLWKKDAELHRRLTETQQLLPQYYAFRWMSLLLSQEFLLPDVIRIWDSLFSDPKRFTFLHFVCLAMLVHVREKLLVNDFSTNMKMLQNFPSVDISELVTLATQLEDENFTVPQTAAEPSPKIQDRTAKLWAHLTSLKQ